MKTLGELYDEVLKSEELKKALAGAVKDGKVEDFIRANGCAASAAEFSAFLKERQSKPGELADEELASVAGGDQHTLSMLFHTNPCELV